MPLQATLSALVTSPNSPADLADRLDAALPLPAIDAALEVLQVAAGMRTAIQVWVGVGVAVVVVVVCVCGGSGGSGGGGGWGGGWGASVVEVKRREQGEGGSLG